MVAGVVTVYDTADGRCPGALHVVPARDGMLARIRVPGGLISSAQLRAIASAAGRSGNGFIDITSRANAQVRGISPRTLADFAEALRTAGLLPSVDHERVRNIAMSPFAGIDPDEHLDVRPFVRELDARVIADPALAELPAKFLFAIDGGGSTPDLGEADVALRAVATAEGPLFNLVLGGTATAYGLRPDDACEAMVTAARAALRFSASCDAPTRMWRVATLAGADACIRAALAPYLFASPISKAVKPARRLGVFRAHRPDLANVVPSIPLGRLAAAQAIGIAEIVERFDADLRLAAWRGVVLGAVKRAAIPVVAAALARLGFVLDDSDGYGGVAACAGIEGCTAALADVRRDAAAFARRRRATHASAVPAVNFAGCAKCCGMRRGAGIDVIASERGYDVAVKGVTVASAVSAEAALELVR